MHALVSNCIGSMRVAYSQVNCEEIPNRSTQMGAHFGVIPQSPMLLYKTQPTNNDKVIATALMVALHFKRNFMQWGSQCIQFLIYLGGIFTNYQLVGYLNSRYLTSSNWVWGFHLLTIFSCPVSYYSEYVIKCPFISK